MQLNFDYLVSIGKPLCQIKTDFGCLPLIPACPFSAALTLLVEPSLGTMTYWRLPLGELGLLWKKVVCNIFYSIGKFI